MATADLSPRLDAPETTASARSTSALRRWVEGAATTAAGTVGIYSALAVVDDVPIIPKLLILAVSCALVYRGLRLIGTAIWGKGFDFAFWLCMAWLGALIIAAVLADVLPLGEHEDTSKTIFELGNASPDLFSDHPLGTNNFGLDLLARSIYGARISLLTVGFAVTISIVVGGGIGLIAGYVRGWGESTINIFTDTLLAIPALILLIALAAVLGSPTGMAESTLKTGTALAAVGTPAMIRLARANSLVFAQREFVLVSKAMGARSGRIILRELLPNVVLPIISYAFIIVAVLIVAEGSLAYLGLGLRPPQPTWGNMIAEADLTTLRQHPHVLLVPATFLFLTVFAFNQIGDRARQVWDPRDTKL